MHTIEQANLCLANFCGLHLSIFCLCWDGVPIVEQKQSSKMLQIHLFFEKVDICQQSLDIPSRYFQIEHAIMVIYLETKIENLGHGWRMTCNSLNCNESFLQSWLSSYLEFVLLPLVAT